MNVKTLKFVLGGYLWKTLLSGESLEVKLRARVVVPKRKHERGGRCVLVLTDTTK